MRRGLASERASLSRKEVIKMEAKQELTLLFSTAGDVSRQIKEEVGC